MNTNNFIPVKPVQDDEGHWYIIPNELHASFNADLCDDEMVDSGEFSNKYGEYMTGGDLNLVQLYTKGKNEVSNFG